MECGNSGLRWAIPNPLPNIVSLIPGDKMKTHSKQQHDENRQLAIWPEGISNEGHVYIALGVTQQEIDTWMQRDLELAQQEGNCDTVAALNAADQQTW